MLSEHCTHCKMKAGNIQTLVWFSGSQAFNRLCLIKDPSLLWWEFLLMSLTEKIHLRILLSSPTHTKTTCSPPHKDKRVSETQTADVLPQVVLDTNCVIYCCSLSLLRVCVYVWVDWCESSCWCGKNADCWSLTIINVQVSETQNCHPVVTITDLQPQRVFLF